LLRLPADASRLAGQPLHTLGFIPDGDLTKAADLSRQVLSGMSWAGTFTGTRLDGTLVFVKVLAVPLRQPPGEIGGLVVLVPAGPLHAAGHDAARDHRRS